jgi:hypothetical protein
LHIVRGGGHLFLLERPAAIAAVVTGFLAAEEAGDVGTTAPPPPDADTDKTPGRT